MENEQIDQKVLYTTHEIAGFCHVSMLAVVKWIDQGKLLGFKTPGGHRRVKRDDLLAFLQHYGFPLPPFLLAFLLIVITMGTPALAGGGSVSLDSTQLSTGTSVDLQMENGALTLLA